MSVKQTSNSVILSAKRLVKQFKSGNHIVNAVNNVSFDVYQGETLAIVGESGCGKSTLGRMLLNLFQPSSGEVTYKNEVLSDLNTQQMRSFRKELQMIFQDPFASLNPRMTVYKTLAEPLKIHQKLKGKELDSAVYDLLELVGLASSHANSYPQEFSGGQRQRIAIARALATKPTLIVGDEPVSALDVSVQAQVINLLNELKAQFGLTLILISHDLSVIEHMADRVIVMYLGQIVEMGTTNEVFNHPRHPYTQALLSSIPHPVPGSNQLKTLQGEIPNPKNLPEGCYFRSRCPYAGLRCQQEQPQVDKIEENSPSSSHQVACFQYKVVPEFTPVQLNELESEDYQSRRQIFQLYS